MRGAVGYQLFSIGLMLFQSFVTAYLIGLEAFGLQVLLLAPVLISQALVEPAIQASMNRTVGAAAFSLNLGHLWACFTLGAVGWAAISLVSIRSLPLICFAIFVCYFFYTSIISWAFAVKMEWICATLAGSLLGFYILAFWIAVEYIGHNHILISAAVGYGGASVLGIILIARSSALSTVSFGVNLGSLLGGLTYRLPTVFFSGFSIVLLGMLGAQAAVVGEFRVFMSAINAGRYFNPVPLAKVQVAISDFVAKDGGSDAREILVRYIFFVSVFSVTSSFIFPLAFDVFFGEHTFSAASIPICALYLVLQPLSYWVLVKLEDGGLVTFMISGLTICFISLIFGSFVLWGFGPFWGVGIASLMAVFIYAVLSYRVIGVRR